MKFLRCFSKHLPLGDGSPIKWRYMSEAAFDQRLPFVNRSFRPEADVQERVLPAKSSPPNEIYNSRADSHFIRGLQLILISDELLKRHQAYGRQEFAFLGSELKRMVGAVASVKKHSTLYIQAKLRLR